MRHRFLVALLITGAFVPLVTHASVFSVIIPQSGLCTCPGSAPDWGCLLQVLQNVINVAIGIGVLVVVLAIVYGAFLLMTGGSNAHTRQQAKNVILNSLVGLAVILGAYLGIDFVMKAVYNPEAVFNGTIKLGGWNAILAPTEGSQCVRPSDQQFITVGNVSIIFPTGGGAPQIGVAGSVCPAGDTACSVQSLSAQGLSSDQAQAMSCIAVTESSGNAGTPDSKTGACGTFQITTRPGNWSNSAYHQGSCTTASSCHNAACNLQTATLMFKSVGYQPWTGKSSNGQYWNPNAVACVHKYDPTGRI